MIEVTHSPKRRGGTDEPAGLMRFRHETATVIVMPYGRAPVAVTLSESLVQSSRGGEEMTAASAFELEDMPGEHRRKGPEIGERYPEVRLLDQAGAVVDLHEARAARPALIVFYRSARW